MPVVLITGCSSGFGKVSAIEFARAGYRVYATARNPDLCAELANIVEREKLPLELLQLEMMDTAAFKPTIEQVVGAAGRIDVLINNAGVAIPAMLEELPDTGIDHVMKVNFFAPVHLSRAVLPYMRRQEYGRIIMLSSLSALIGLPGEAVYAASKAALEAAAEALRHEVGRFNIFVSVVEPGLFNTEMPGKIAGGFICPPDSVYAKLLRHLQKKMRSGLGRGDDPARVAELLLAIVREEKPVFRYPAGAQATTILERINKLTARSRERFIHSVNDTAWWSAGKSGPD